MKTRRFLCWLGNRRRRPVAGARLLEAVRDLRAWWWLSTRKSLDSWLRLRAAIGEDTPLVTEDGGLMSLFELHGCRQIGGQEQLAALADGLTMVLAAALRNPGHAVHMVFDRDPEAGSGIATEAVRPARDAARRLRLDLDDVLDDRCRDLGGRVSREHCYIALWTRETALMPAERARSGSEIRARRKTTGGTAASQEPEAVHGGLVPRHEALVRDLVDGAGRLHLALRTVGAAEALGVMRTFLGGHAGTADTALGSIEARSHGLVSGGGSGEGVGTEEASDSRSTPQRRSLWLRSADDPSDGFHRPALAPGLIGETPKVEGGLVQIGGRHFAGLHVTLGPTRLQPFNGLLTGLARAGVPFRQSLLIEGGPGILAGKHFAASVLALGSAVNGVIRDQIEALRRAEADGEPLVRVSMSWQTWASDPETARRRRDSLAQRVGAWGDQSVSVLLGDPLESWAATIPGFTALATAPRAVAPLRDVLALAPLQRPASMGSGNPREMGDQILAGNAGKPLGQPVTAGGEHAFELVFGEPGKGKSVLLNSRALAAVLAGSQEQLPLIAILDVGPSAAGLVSLLRAALPLDRRDEALHLRLTHSAHHAINPFDTPVGCRRPSAHQAVYLANLVGAMLRPAEASALPAGLDTLVPEVIAEAYRLRDDGPPGSQPNLYEPGVVPEVDEVLARDGPLMGAGLPWWAVVDRMLALRRHDLAASAQRHAVPVLADLVSAANSDRVRDRHAQVRLSSGEAPAEALTRILGAVQRDFAGLAGRTALNLGAARVAVLDLAEVADPGNPRRTAVMYLAARQALAGDWFLTPEDVAAMPPGVREWHGERVRALLETEKVLQFDEFHRAGGVPELVAQVGLDAREGRKHRRRVVLASQQLDDFDASLRRLASTIWILGADSVETQRRIIDSFDLDAGAAEVVRRDLSGPGPARPGEPGGAPALLISQTGVGRGQQLVHVLAGPSEIWALTTTPRDAALRERLYRRLPPGVARAALAARFPAGTIGREFPPSQAGAESGDWNAAERRRLDELAAEIIAAADGVRMETVRQAIAATKAGEPPVLKKSGDHFGRNGDRGPTGGRIGRAA